MPRNKGHNEVILLRKATLFSKGNGGWDTLSHWEQHKSVSHEKTIARSYCF